MEFSDIVIVSCQKIVAATERVKIEQLEKEEALKKVERYLEEVK